MSFLPYISDQLLIKEVKHVLDIGRNRKQEAEKKFNHNVIDPFAALFEAAGFAVNHQTWKNSETIRQCQKTVQNHVGTLHQKILGHIDGWQDLGTGSVIDLICEEKKIIAEVKNKYNTVTGGKLAEQYYSLEKLVSLKASRYKDYTAYFVNIIPKKPDKYNIPFIPSDKEKGIKCPENTQIRIIDGASFYNLVTNRESAIEEFYSVLPRVIEHIFSAEYQQDSYQLPDKDLFTHYFSLAYKNNHD